MPKSTYFYDFMHTKFNKMQTNLYLMTKVAQGQGQKATIFYLEALQDTTM